MTILSK